MNGVPPGRYTYRAWRPEPRTMTGSVVGHAGATLEVRLP